jgi:hypothetical protein
LHEGRDGAFQDLVDQTINAVFGTQRFVLAPGCSGKGVMGTFHFDAVKPRTGNLGFLRYYESTLSLILTDSAHAGDINPKLYVFNPVMILNDAYAMLAGREIYGFPKMLGSFEASGFPESGNSATQPIEDVTAVVSVLGFPVESSSLQANPCETHRMTVTILGTLFENFQELTGDIFLNALDPLFNNPDWNMTKGFLGNVIEAVFLKQFPECGDCTRMCYRSVVRAPYHVSKLRNIRFGYGTVTLQNPTSYPLATAMGYSAGQSVNGLGFIANTEWELGEGRVF